MLYERRDALEREVQLKAKMVIETEEKIKKVQDEMDLKIYTINDQSKVINDQRLKIDIVQTKSEGLSAEIRHLEVLLKEATEFKNLFEIDNAKVRQEYS